MLLQQFGNDLVLLNEQPANEVSPGDGDLLFAGIIDTFPMIGHGRQPFCNRHTPAHFPARETTISKTLWSDADACLSDCSIDNVIDILDIVHVSGYVGKAAKVLVRGETAQEEFIRDRLLRILRGDVHCVVRGRKRPRNPWPLGPAEAGHGGSPQASSGVGARA